MKSNNTYKVHKRGDLTFYEIHNPKHSNNVAVIQFNVGSIDDASKHGIAHLAEHIISKSDSASNIKREIDGITFNATTQKERTYYIASSYLSSAASVISSLVNNIKFTFDDTDMKEELSVIRNEILGLENDHYDRIYNQITNKLLGKMYHSVIGDVRSLKTIKAEDVRDFIEKNYINPKVVILSSSKISKLDENKIFKFISKFKFTSTTRVTRKAPDESIVNRYLNFSFESMQVHGFSIKNSNKIKEDIYMSLLTEYLSNNWSSIFNQELRIKKPLTYFINGYYSIYKDYSILYLPIECQKKDKDKVNLITKQILRDVKDGKISEDIFKVAKNMLLAKNYKGLTNEEGITTDFLWFNQFDQTKLYTIEEYVKEATSVTFKSFKQEVTKYLKDIVI